MHVGTRKRLCTSVACVAQNVVRNPSTSAAPRVFLGFRNSVGRRGDDTRAPDKWVCRAGTVTCAIHTAERSCLQLWADRTQLGRRQPHPALSTVCVASHATGNPCRRGIGDAGIEDCAGCPHETICGACGRGPADKDRWVRHAAVWHGRALS